MSNPALDSVRLKIDRAKQHFNYLGSAINTRSAEQAGKAVSTELDPHRGGFKLPQDTGSHLAQWSLIVGDAFHNLRSALDHLVLRLAVLNGTSHADAQEVTFFPVCLDGPSFRSSVKGFKRCISQETLAALKTLQPYTTANAVKIPAKHNILYIVSQLDNIDKHRMLLVIEGGFSITDVTLRRKDESIIKPSIRPDVWAPMKDTAELGSVDFSGVNLEGDETVDMDVYASVDVFLNEPELELGDRPVKLRVLLRRCIERVDAVVNAFGKQFFGE